jgi:hypothetical protein
MKAYVIIDETLNIGGIFLSEKKARVCVNRLRENKPDRAVSYVETEIKDFYETRVVK